MTDLRWPDRDGGFKKSKTLPVKERFEGVRKRCGGRKELSFEEED